MKPEDTWSSHTDRRARMFTEMLQPIPGNPTRTVLVHRCGTTDGHWPEFYIRWADNGERERLHEGQLKMLQWRNWYPDGRTTYMDGTPVDLGGSPREGKERK